MKNCGNCIHWKQAKPYTWGICHAPLPFWAEHTQQPPLKVDDARARDCGTYELNEFDGIKVQHTRIDEAARIRPGRRG